MHRFFLLNAACIYLGICTPLLKKIRADLRHNVSDSGDDIGEEGEEDEAVNRLNKNQGL